MDDYSRITWLNLFRYKSEVMNVFKNFHKRVTTRFGCHIHSLRIDNGLNICLTTCHNTRAIMEFFIKIQEEEPL